MTLPATISADYTLRPSELAEVLATLVQARQPTLVWGPPGAAKSMIARQVRREVGESLIGACVRREPTLQRSPAFIRWAAAKTQ